MPAETRSSPRPVVPIPPHAAGKTIPLPVSRWDGLWFFLHGKFARAMLFIAAYCLIVIALVSAIAFRGVSGIGVVTGVLGVGAILLALFPPGPRKRFG